VKRSSTSNDVGALADIGDLGKSPRLDYITSLSILVKRETRSNPAQFMMGAIIKNTQFVPNHCSYMLVSSRGVIDANMPTLTLTTLQCYGQARCNMVLLCLIE
jgi:hypothetical protein